MVKIQFCEISDKYCIHLNSLVISDSFHIPDFFQCSICSVKLFIMQADRKRRMMGESDISSVHSTHVSADSLEDRY